MVDIDTEIRQTFIEEARQLLDEAEAALIALDGGDGSKERIEQIFRLAHNF
ncbi:MAG: hypothetical protein RJB38_442 [Pseudomonadota bacterium]|jgi:chemotaxis protein histidine kinase CheA